MSQFAAFLHRSRKCKILLMNSPIIELLAQIASGISIFEPFRRTGREMLEFQETVHRLQEMEAQGLISRLFLQKREIAGQSFCDLVMVTNGLTEEGRRLLEEHQGMKQD